MQFDLYLIFNVLVALVIWFFIKTLFSAFYEVYEVRKKKAYNKLKEKYTPKPTKFQQKIDEAIKKNQKTT
jgi:hypothetical protein